MRVFSLNRHTGSPGCHRSLLRLHPQKVIFFGLFAQLHGQLLLRVGRRLHFHAVFVAYGQNRSRDHPPVRLQDLYLPASLELVFLGQAAAILIRMLNDSEENIVLYI